jgi:hypothetical protein
VPNESLSSSDVASYTTGTSNLSTDSSSGVGGVHVVTRSEADSLDTSGDTITSEPQTITVHPVIHDETEGPKEKRRHKKLSPKEEQLAVFGGIGFLNVIALAGLGFWSWKRLSRGDNGWKVVGIAAGLWVGINAVEWFGVRYLT